jgi:hypothetical protein
VLRDGAAALPLPPLRGDRREEARLDEGRLPFCASKPPFGASSTDCGPSGRVRAPPPRFSPCHGRRGWGRTDRSDPGALKPAT